MSSFAVLTSRKRAFIALIHSVIFLLIALRAVAVPHPTLGLVSAMQLQVGAAGALAMTVVFALVSAILILLFAMSRGLRERLYFGFCSVSAATGLLRCIVGDPPFHTANLIRALMLTCAVVVGTMIWREHGESELSSD